MSVIKFLIKFLVKLVAKILVLPLILFLNFVMLVYNTVEGIVGLIAFVLLLLAGIIGSVLWKDKKVKSLRTTHTALIAFSIIIGVFHILSS